MENILVNLQHYVCNSWWIIALKRQLNIQLVWKLKKVRQLLTLILQNVYLLNTPVKLQHDIGNLWWVLCSQCVAVCHSFDLELVWKFIKGQTKVNIEIIRNFNREKIPVMLQHNACDSWEDITFTRITHPMTIPLQSKVLIGKNTKMLLNCLFLIQFPNLSSAESGIYALTII